MNDNDRMQKWVDGTEPQSLKEYIKDKTITKDEKNILKKVHEDTQATQISINTFIANYPQLINQSQQNSTFAQKTTQLSRIK